MRITFLFAATAVLAVAAAAQNSAIKTKPGLITPSTGRPGGALPGLTKNALTVNYPDQPGISVVLETKPALTFTCKLTTSGSYPNKACTASTVFQTVELRAGYTKDTKILVGIPPTMITGPQWEGDCKGTAGDTCLLDMSQPRTVQINFNGGTIGIGIGTASDSKN